MLRPTSRPPGGAFADARPAPPPGTSPGAGRNGKVLGGVLGGIVLVAAGVLASFGPVVRSRIAKEAERRHVDVDVGSVRPGFFAVVLHHVTVRPHGVEGVAVELDEVRAELSAGLSLRELVVHGGRATISGEPEDVVDRLEPFRRAPGGASEKEAAGGKRTPVTLDGLALAWHAPSGATLTGEGLRFARTDEALKIGADHLETTRDRVTLATRGVDVELAPNGAPRRLAAATLEVALAGDPKDAKTPAPPKTAAADPAPPPLPPPVRSAKGAKGAAKTPAAAPPAPDDAARDEPVLPHPDLHALRSRIALATKQLESRLPEGMRVDVGGLALKLDVAGEPVAFGPGPFALERRGGSIHVTFSSGDRGTADKPAEGAPTTPPGTPLSLDLELPLGPGDVVARLAGGPVSLAVLGVKDGTKGLKDAAHGLVSGKGQLALAADGDALTFDGNLALRGISLEQPRLAPDPIKDLAFGAAARGVLEAGGRLRIDEAQLDMGALHVRTHGTVEETDHFAVSLGVDIAPAGCQALLDSAPRGLLPTVQDMRMTGTFGATAQVVFDTRTIDKMLLDYKVDDACRVLEVPRGLVRDRFSGSFTYRTYHPDGTQDDTTTGPGTPDWTDLDAISPFMVAAVLTTEDGAFYKHHGFNHAAIRGAVQANLKARRFVRGASTITMQLAKNLFLTRSKNLSRKFEEVILTDYLEQVFQKDEMMELYLNVVEFGPDVYGITRAADYYFGRKPEELNLPEAFFLATLLPSPLRYGKLRDKGVVGEGWLKHLHTLMEIAAKNGKISRAELAEGLEQTVTFVRPGDARPEPRKPVTTKRRDPYEDDAAWQPLD